MTEVPNYTLANGVQIPCLGLGTWKSAPGQVESAVEYALKDAGYRHIDCAFAYGNEAEVGEGIKNSGVPRDQIFITSKIWSTYHSRVEESLDITLKDLGTDYIDLLLIHWPIAMNPNGSHPLFPLLPSPPNPPHTRDILPSSTWAIRQTWAQLEDIYTNTKKIRAIGVSNFSRAVLEEEIFPYCKIKPMVNQLELHPYNPQFKLVEWLTSEGIQVEAYSPLGSGGDLIKDEVVEAIASRLSVGVANVLIAWGLAKKMVLIPKSTTPERILSNLQSSLSVLPELTEKDIADIDSLAGEGGKQMRYIKPPWTGVKLGFEDWMIG